MIIVKCLIVIFNGQERFVYPDAVGETMTMKGQYLYVDFNKYMRENKIPSSMYMLRLNHSDCVKVR